MCFYPNLGGVSVLFRVRRYEFSQMHYWCFRWQVKLRYIPQVAYWLGDSWGGLPPPWAPLECSWGHYPSRHPPAEEYADAWNDSSVELLSKTLTSLAPRPLFLEPVNKVSLLFTVLELGSESWYYWELLEYFCRIVCVILWWLQFTDYPVSVLWALWGNSFCEFFPRSVVANL